MTALRKIEAHAWAREENEHYVEPTWCSERLFQEETFSNGIFDPCCGFGRIPSSAFAAGHSIRASDLIDRGYSQMTHQGDFLEMRVSPMPNIVCNPPFDIAPKFALHALNLATEKVAMIFPTARLNAAHWLRGTPLRRVWFLTPRPSMPPGHVIARGEKPGGGKMDYCWLVWEHGWTGEAEIRWLRREK